MRTVILFELDNLCVFEILFKVQDVAHIRAAPGIDTLVVVPHDKEIAPLAGKELDQFVLYAVGVLIFIHQHIAETVGVIFARFPVLL